MHERHFVTFGALYFMVPTESPVSSITLVHNSEAALLTKTMTIFS